ncbi:MAG: hypothetical protein ABIP51_22610 [Bacteroidia bacterium]
MKKNDGLTYGQIEQMKEDAQMSIDTTSSQTIAKPNVIGSPNQLEPVLALITHQGDLGLSEWYEVVYYLDKWCSYSGSKTFEDGEQVVKWKPVTDCL